MNNLTQNLVARQIADTNKKDETSDSIHESKLGYIFFIGYPGHLFKGRAPCIFNAMGRRLTGVISDNYCVDFSHMTIYKENVPIVSMDQFREIAKLYPVEVIYFFEDCDDLWKLSLVQSAGDRVTVVDCLEKMAQLGLYHTYQTVFQEQTWWRSQSDERIDQISHMFGDKRSQQTLSARALSIQSGQRKYLMQCSVANEYEYFNKNNKFLSFVPGTEEYYVDVGAAHGDTVDKFISVVNGQFLRIDAFEPTPGQFRQLATRTLDDKRIHAHPFAVGANRNMIDFYDNPSNPFGGNALTFNNNSKDIIQVQCIKLDDMIEKCTLLKMDVEGFECQVLRGATQLIKRNKPNMAVTCYHYPQDMFEILELVSSIHTYRHVALRHYSSSLYDSILLFSDHQSFE